MRPWLMLFLFSMLTADNNLVWISLSAIRTKVIQTYQLTSAELNVFPIVFYVVYIVFTLPALWFINTYGMYWSVTLAAFFNAVGAAVRCFETYVSFVVGNGIAALATPIFYIVPTKISQIWFGDEDRIIATSLEMLAFNIGTLVAFLLAYENYSIININIGIAVSAVIIFIFILFFFQNHGGVTSCSLAAKLFGIRPKKLKRKGEKEYKLYELISLLKMHNFLVLLLTYSLIQPISWTLITIIEEIVTPDSVSIITGIISVSSSILGSIIIGYFLKYHYIIKIVILISCILCALTLLGLSIYQNIVWFDIIFGIYSFFAGSLASTFLEMGAQITYPISEVISACLFLFCGNLFSAIYTIIASFVTDSYILMWIYFGISLLGLLVFILFYPVSTFKEDMYFRRMVREKKISTNKKRALRKIEWIKHKEQKKR